MVPIIQKAVSQSAQLILALAGLCLSASSAFAQTAPAGCESLTDHLLTVSTPVKAAHVSELRTCINAIRVLNSLSAYTWTDPSLTAGVSAIKAVHVAELRVALGQVYTQLSQSTPSYTDPTLTAGSTTIKRAHVQELRTAAFVLFPPLTPSINPATGTYTAEQSVTLSLAESGVDLRYTTNGSDPTASSPLYTAAFQVTTGTTVKARTFRTGGATSPVSSAVYTFNYGTLATPAATPGAGAFQQAPAVSLSGPNGATIRYTINGADPTESSSLYSGPISIPSGGGQLRAKAFQADWTASAVLNATYAIDTTAPTITASVWPPANAAGWHNTQATVTFTCSDNLPGVSCPDSVVVNQDGIGQVVSRSATDAAGNTTPASVTISLDTVAPQVVLTSPSNGQITSAATVGVSATVSDAGSGPVSAMCNGDSAQISAGTMTCTVALKPGRNSVVAQVTDAADNNASSGAYVTRAGVATSVSLTPTTRTLAVWQTTTLTLRDEFGVQVGAASWQSSDTDVVTLSTDDPPILMAVGLGEATISVTKNGLASDATITVLPALEDGNTFWSVAPVPGRTMQWPIYTNRIELESPDMFTTELDTDGFIMRAVKANGEVLWTESSPGIPLMGDVSGGVITGVPLADGDYDNPGYLRALVRTGGSSDAMPWRYEPDDAFLRGSSIAQAHDGTIYAVEYLLNVPGSQGWADHHAIVIDGRTGRLISRLPLARETSVGCSGVVVKSPDVAGPIAGADGRGYMLVRRLAWTDTSSCGGARTASVGIDLIVLGPNAAPIVLSVYSNQCVPAFAQRSLCDFGPDLFSLMPDGLLGVLISWQRPTTVPTVPSPTINDYQFKRFITRFDETLTLAFTVQTDASLQMSTNSGTVYVVEGTELRSMDSATWTTNWSSPEAQPVMPLPDEQLAVRDPETNEMLVLNSSGQAESSAPMDLSYPVQIAYGLWSGVSSSAPDRITAVFSTPAGPTHGWFSSTIGGAPSGNWAPLPQLLAKREDTAAVFMLSFLYAAAQKDGVEYSGSVCRKPSGTSPYYLDRIKKGTPTSSPSVDMNPEKCINGATTVAHGHTHPTQKTSAGGYFWTDAYPSGFDSESSYHDASNQQGNQPSDLKNADLLFDQPGDPRYQNLTRYLAAPSFVATQYNGVPTLVPTGTADYLRYKKTTDFHAKDNIYRYNFGTDTWGWVGPAPWQ